MQELLVYVACTLYNQARPVPSMAAVDFAAVVFAEGDLNHGRPHSTQCQRRSIVC